MAFPEAQRRFLTSRCLLTAREWVGDPAAEVIEADQCPLLAARLCLEMFGKRESGADREFDVGEPGERRGRIGIEPQFIVWGESPTKAGLSPAVELQ